VKIARIVDVPDLTTPVGPSDFANRAKYVAKDSIVVKFDERYPFTAVMPVEPKNFNANAAIAVQKKYLIDLTFSDWELLRFAYQKAVEHDIASKTVSRKKNLRRIMDDDNAHVIKKEVTEQRFRILMTWIGRFHMEKIFENVRLHSMDDFKRFMTLSHARSSGQHRVQLQLFLRQFGLDPKQTPPLPVFQRMTGEDQIILRAKAAEQSKIFLNFTDIRLKMAQLQAAAQFTQHMNAHQASVDTGDALRANEALTDMKIKEIK
jgi:hypothetical protein